MKYFIGNLDQVFVKPLAIVFSLRPLGHDNTIKELLCSSGSLGKSKIDLRQLLTRSFHDASQNPDTIPQQTTIKWVGDIALNNRRINTKSFSFFQFFLLGIGDQNFIDPSPSVSFDGFDNLLKRCVMGNRIRVESGKPTQGNAVL